MEPLKNMFSSDFISELSLHIGDAYSSFDSDAFRALVFDSDWDTRELKERMRHITCCLRDTLPTQFEEAVHILMRVSDSVKSNDIQFPYIVLPDFVEQYGQDDWETSMTALEVVTQSSSSEFAVRPFLVSDRDRTLERMMSWASHPNVHVRRLASEGSRPRLPWGMALQEFKRDPDYTLPILELLKADPELYVRRSVANHLNDISKDHEAVAVDVATRWFGVSKETDWVVKHAMRGLLKKGTTSALRLFGFSYPDSVSLLNLQLSSSTCFIGDRIDLLGSLQHNAPLKTRLEFAVDYVKQNGSVSRKVFMISEKHMAQGKSEFKKVVDFSDKTTRKHYPGNHDICILVNGVEMGKVSLHLHAKAQ